MKDKILAVQEFHEAFKIGYLTSPKADLGIEKNSLRYRLMKEENDEYLEAAKCIRRYAIYFMWNNT